MDAKGLKAMGIDPVSSIKEGLSKAYELPGRDASITLLPEGSVVYARA